MKIIRIRGSLKPPFNMFLYHDFPRGEMEPKRLIEIITGKNILHKMVRGEKIIEGFYVYFMVIGIESLAIKDNDERELILEEWIETEMLPFLPEGWFIGLEMPIIRQAKIMNDKEFYNIYYFHLTAVDTRVKFFPFLRAADFLQMLGGEDYLNRLIRN